MSLNLIPKWLKTLVGILCLAQWFVFWLLGRYIEVKAAEMVRMVQGVEGLTREESQRILHIYADAIQAGSTGSDALYAAIAISGILGIIGIVVLVFMLKPSSR